MSPKRSFLENLFHGLLLLFAGALLALLLAGAFTNKAHPAEIEPEQVALLYSFAYGHVGFIPEKNPVIRVVTRETMCKVAERAICHTAATEREGVVYLVDTLDLRDAWNRSILLHELVHYVQWAQHGEPPTCEERLRREYQAYEIQAKALHMIGHPVAGLKQAARALRCS